MDVTPWHVCMARISVGPVARKVIQGQHLQPYGQGTWALYEGNEGVEEDLDMTPKMGTTTRERTLVLDLTVVHSGVS